MRIIDLFLRPKGVNKLLFERHIRFGMKWVCPMFFLLSAGNLRAEPESGVSKLHIFYLLQSKQLPQAIDLYREYQKNLGAHDFEVLQQMALILLESGARSTDPELQLASLYGSLIAGIEIPIDVLEAGIASPYPQMQMATIQSLGSLQEDRSEELLTRAMSSDFFFTRMEAASQLAARKARTAVGQIESLMHKVPEGMRFFFPPFFARIGTHDAIAILRQLMDSPFHMTRVESILNAARFGRDDFLPMIRSHATHLNIAEQEACATALGWLKDSKSLPLLKKLERSPSDHIKLAAKRALLALGDLGAEEGIAKMAREKDLFAITVLGEVLDRDEELIALVKDQDLQLRFNAVFALLQQKNPKAKDYLLEFLLRDSRDLGFQPIYSLGNSLMAWKVIPSALQHRQKELNYDLCSLSLHVREAMLRECVELPEETFLSIANGIFDSRQTDLIPLVVRLLENGQTPPMLDLLRARAQMAGGPLIRAYCNLALFRLNQGEEYRKAVCQWIDLKKQEEMVRFRPMLPWELRLAKQTSPFELTPDEHSRLLIESYQSLAMEHEEMSIEIILNGIQQGHSKNRPILSGLLIQAIQ